jgi:large repetitive protein
MRSFMRSWRICWTLLRHDWADRHERRSQRRRRARRHAERLRASRLLGFEQLEPRLCLSLSFSVDDVSVTEAGGLTFTISASGTGMGSVQYGTANGTASSTSDYAPTSGTKWFNGTGSQTVTVGTNTDNLDEDDETLYLNLSNASGGSIGDGQGLGTILDDDSPPTVNVGDTSGIEGTGLTFAVTLSTVSGRAVTVGWGTANDTAIAGQDYTAASGTVTFNAGETSKTFTVTTTNDTLDEANETFFANLTSATNATIGDGQGVGTIQDNDDQPTVSISNATAVTEGQNLQFQVNLSAASGQTVTVAYATSDVTATAGQDYTAASGTLTFAAGETSKTVTVQTTDDALDEDTEQLRVTLSNPTNATLGTSQATGDINDNDGPPELSVLDTWAIEGQNAVFTVVLSRASGKQITVGYATVDGTAVSTSDYTTASGTLTFTAGQTSKTVSVATTNDAVQEPKEHFYLDISSPTNARSTINAAKRSSWTTMAPGP